MNQGIHGIDLMQYILGEPKVVSSKIATRHHAVEVEDAATALIEFDDGAMGMIQGSTCTWPGFERRLEIRGDKGYVVLKENQIEQLDTPEDQLDMREKAVQGVGSYNKPDMIDSHMHSLQIRNLLNAVQGKDQLLIDASEGRKAIRIIEDIYNAAKK